MRLRFLLAFFFQSLLFAGDHTVENPKHLKPRPLEDTPRAAVLMGANTKIGLFFPSLFSPEKKTAVVERVGIISARELDRVYNVEEVVNVMGGNYVQVGRLKENQFAGSNGAGPCIGVIIFTMGPGGVNKATVFHFTAMDHPYKTLSKMGPYPKGSRVAIFGGENTKESNATLASVMQYLDKYGSAQGKNSSKPLTIDGYSNTEGLWVNRNGEYVKYRTDRTSEDNG